MREGARCAVIAKRHALANTKFCRHFVFSRNSDIPGSHLQSQYINIKQIISIFSKMKNTADDSRVQLIYALRPHLSEERRARADTAVKMLKLLDMLPLIKESGLLKGIL